MWYAWETFKACPGAGVTNTLPILTLGSSGSLWRLSGEEARKVTAWPNNNQLSNSFIMSERHTETEKLTAGLG